MVWLSASVTQHHDFREEARADPPPGPTASLDEADSDRGVQAEDNTFLMCDNFEREAWIELLPPRDTDSDRRFRTRLVSNQAQVRSSQVSFVVASSAWCGQGFGVSYDELPTKSRF